MAETALRPPSDDIPVVDVPLTELTPIQKRTAAKLNYQRLEASIRSVGLIEPLLVHQHQRHYFILDGFLRYQVLQSLGVTHAPCLLIDNLDLYTPNRQVSYISMAARWKMLKRALTVVDESRLKESLGLKHLRGKLSTAQEKGLCPEVHARIRDERMTQGAARALLPVTFERQREILEIADRAGDISIAFIRAMVLKTPPDQRSTGSLRKDPWDRAAQVRKSMIERLASVEKHHDFFQGLYRQYAQDLIKLVIYAREMLTHKPLRDYLSRHHPKEYELMQQVIQQASDAKPRKG
jgi:ParB family transcriptional regulator, chromosome partitioning protein